MSTTWERWENWASTSTGPIFGAKCIAWTRKPSAARNWTTATSIPTIWTTGRCWLASWSSLIPYGKAHSVSALRPPTLEATAPVSIRRDGCLPPTRASRRTIRRASPNTKCNWDTGALAQDCVTSMSAPTTSRSASTSQSQVALTTTSFPTSWLAGRKTCGGCNSVTPNASTAPTITPSAVSCSTTTAIRWRAEIPC